MSVFLECDAMLWEWIFITGTFCLFIFNSYALCPEDGGRTLIHNVRNFPLDYTASHAKRQPSLKCKKLQNVRVKLEPNRLLPQLVLKVRIISFIVEGVFFNRGNCWL
jgi:hypothetical protein